MIARHSHLYETKDLLRYLLNFEDYPSILPIVKDRIARELSRVDQYSLSEQDHKLVDPVFSSLMKGRFSGEQIDGLDYRRQSPHSCILAKQTMREGDQRYPQANKLITLRLLSATLLSYPSWLQSIAKANLGHRRDSACLFRLLSRAIQSDSKFHSIRQQIRLRLIDLGEPLPTLDGFASMYTNALPDWVYLPPLMYLSLSRFSRSYFPEILGFTLAEVIKPLTQRLYRLLEIGGIELSFEQNQDDDFDAAIVFDAIEQHIQLEPSARTWSRIRSGLSLNFALHQNLAVNIEEQLQQSQTLENQVIQLFKAKAPYAIGYHASIPLGGKSLDDWFAEHCFDGKGFIDALLKSDYFDPDHSSTSRFFTELTAFKGPMFGIFTNIELETIRRWTDKANDRPLVTPQVITKPDQLTSACATTVELPRPPGTIGNAHTTRELFFRLLNIEQYPKSLPAAKAYVERMLAKTKRYLLFRKSSNTLGKFHYSHQKFNTYIEHLYRREVEKFKEIEGPPKLTKDVYLWGILQFAPTVLVDGCWLQATTTNENWDDPITSQLFRIFADEIGDGVAFQNHSNVYRNLLASLDIQLPEFDSEAFARFPDFLDSAFDIPAYLLALSEFQKTFLAEMIGVNLAIELSGLGADYRDLAKNLEYWGIDPHIVRLHQSIDNLASGHAAIARKVIMEYLDRIMSAHGYHIMEQHWRRIGIGYYSLNAVSKNFKWALIRAYCRKFLFRRYGWFAGPQF